MGFKAVKCPACGSTIELDESREFGFCSYCGTKVVQDKIVVEHRGSISVSGVANDQSLLDRAFLFLEDSDFSNANLYFEKVLDINPKCSKAYIGKLLCKYRLTSVSDISKIDTKLENEDFFLKAKRFANAKELKEYETYENAVLQKLHQRLDGFKKELSDLTSKKEAKQKEIEIEKAKHKKYKVQRILWIILIPVFTFIASFCFILIMDCFFGSDPVISLGIVLLILIFVPSCLGIVFAFRKKKKTEELITIYYTKCREKEAINERIRKLQKEFESWAMRVFGKSDL